MFSRRTLHQCLIDLGMKVLDEDGLKAVMISKNDDGDVQITLIEGGDESKKVRFGRINGQTRQLTRDHPKSIPSQVA